MAKKLKGIVPPLLTPLTKECDLDVQGTQKLIEHVINGGVHGIFILGTTGEANSLDYDVRQKLIIETCKTVKGRIPVLIGITDTSMGESLKLAHIAKEHGASAVVAAPPFYFNLGQEELLQYYNNLADRIPLPLFLYNMPSLTKVNICKEIVIQLAEHSNIIGLKDSSGNGPYFQSILYSLRDNLEFTLLVGSEEIMAETVLMGGNGGVTGGANLFPKLFVALYEACLKKDFSKIDPLQKLVMELGSKLYNQGLYHNSSLQALKIGLSTLGVAPHVAPPLLDLTEKEKGRIISNLNEIESKMEILFKKLASLEHDQV